MTDYTGSVTAFKVGDLDLAWYGGLTGVQARLQVPGAHAIAQRDIDTAFHAVSEAALRLFPASNALSLTIGLTPIVTMQVLRRILGETLHAVRMG